MAQSNNGLPEGTDTIVEGGGTGGSGDGTGRSGTTGDGFSPSTTTNSTGGKTAMTASDAGTDSLITDGTSGSGANDDTGGTSSGGGGGGGSGGIRGMLSTGATKARDEAATRARGLVSQGLTSGSTTLSNVASIIEDTVEQIGERLGPQYADYARTASQTVNRYASTLQNKDPDELVDDARELVRKSPGVALAGAAIVGFGLVRLLKAGIESGSETSGNSGRNNRQSA